MNLDENLHITIQRYLEGQMSSEETAAFEAILKKDMDLKEQVEIIKKMDVIYSEEDWDHLDADSDKLKEIVGIFREKETLEFSDKIKMVHQSVENENIPKKRSILWYASSAAAIILLFFIGYNYFGDEASMTELYQRYYSESDLPSFAIKSDEVNTLTKAELLFKERKFEQAAFLFDSIQQTVDQVNPNILLFLAQTQSELGNDLKALQHLEFLAKSTTLDHHKAYWFKAMIYLKLGDKQSAIDQLKIITQNNSYFNHEKALELLDKLY